MFRKQQREEQNRLWRCALTWPPKCHKIHPRTRAMLGFSSFQTVAASDLSSGGDLGTISAPGGGFEAMKFMAGPCQWETRAHDKNSMLVASAHCAKLGNHNLSFRWLSWMVSSSRRPLLARNTHTHTRTHTYIHTCIHAYMHTCTYAQTQTHRHTDTQTHRHKHTDTQTHKHTNTESRKHRHTQTQAHTHTTTYKHTCVHAYIHAYTGLCFCSHCANR